MLHTMYGDINKRTDRNSIQAKRGFINKNQINKATTYDEVKWYHIVDAIRQVWYSQPVFAYMPDRKNILFHRVDL